MQCVIRCYQQLFHDTSLKMFMFLHPTLRSLLASSIVPQLIRKLAATEAYKCSEKVSVSFMGRRYGFPIITMFPSSPTATFFPFVFSYLYQIAHLGDDDEEPEFSSAMPLEEGDTFFFQPRPLKNLVLVDEQENLSPIMSCQVSSWVLTRSHIFQMDTTKHGRTCFI